MKVAGGRPPGGSPRGEQASKGAAVLLVAVLTALFWVLAMMGVMSIVSGLGTGGNPWMGRAHGELVFGAVVISALLTVLLGSMVRDLWKSRSAKAPR